MMALNRHRLKRLLKRRSRKKEHPGAGRARLAMLLNILELEKATVDDIMVPRGSVYGLNLGSNDKTLLSRIQQSEYTRLPVYEESINNLRGFLHTRKVSRFIDQNGFHRQRMLEELEPPYFIPEGTPLHEQLLNFQQHKHRIAVVVDEYGEVLGLVALEDILEEIVGEFTSNLAEAVEDIFPQPDGSYMISGSASVRDINKSLGWELPLEGPKTLNGLLLEQLESFPDGNVGVGLEGYYLEILDLQGNVIQSVRARAVPLRPPRTP